MLKTVLSNIARGMAKAVSDSVLAVLIPIGALTPVILLGVAAINYGTAYAIGFWRLCGLVYGVAIIAEVVVIRVLHIRAFAKQFSQENDLKALEMLMQMSNTGTITLPLTEDERGN